MTHYQQPIRLYQNPAANMSVAGHMSLDRTVPRAGRAGISMSKAMRFLVAAIIQVAVLLLAIEMTLGLGYDGPPGPMPAPAPSPMR